MRILFQNRKIGFTSGLRGDEAGPPRTGNGTGGGEAGQSLVELIVAVGLVIMAITALLSLGVISLRSSTFSQSKVTATKLANAEMELVRALRDSWAWGDFATGIGDCVGPACTQGCYVDASGASLTLNNGPETVDRYTRCFLSEALDDPPHEIKITVKVSWTDQGGTREVPLSSVLTDWR